MHWQNFSSFLVISFEGEVDRRLSLRSDSGSKMVRTVAFRKRETLFYNVS